MSSGHGSTARNLRMGPRTALIVPGPGFWVARATSAARLVDSRGRFAFCSLTPRVCGDGCLFSALVPEGTRRTCVNADRGTGKTAKCVIRAVSGRV